MKIFAIKDESDLSKKVAAYLIYYEQDKQFYIELPEAADPWETPLLLSSFLKRGEMTVNSYWSRMWVQQRIVPPDRQNIGEILKANSLDTYDEFELLMLADGRCAQDEYYLTPVSEADLTDEFFHRFQKRVEDVIALAGRNLLVFFRDRSVKKCDMGPIMKKLSTFSVVMKNDEIFHEVSIQPGGYGVRWGENLNVSYDTLYNCGIDIMLSLDDFREFAASRIVTTAEAAEILQCSRQNIDDLIHRGKLHPVKETLKNKLFLKSEILQRKWK